jgi:inosose dehydratase
MTTPFSRRTFLYGLGAAAAASSMTARRLAALDGATGFALEPALYPPMDLSHFDTPVTPAPSDIRIGYASITWGGKDRDAIADIADLGYPGIQLRSNILPDWQSRPQALVDELAARRLTFVALSSGSVDAENGPAAEIALRLGHAKFLRDCHGLYLQCTDQRPKRPLVRADYERLGKLLTEIGKRTADLGIALGYHNHMGTSGERPDEVEQILAAADPRYVRFELDIAHYRQGGGDPVQAIRTYRDRLLFLHIKDVEPTTGGSGPGYRFVELGRGIVDIKGVFAALAEVKFRGWAVVELDAVPDKARTPKESAAINLRYIEEQCGLKVVERT